MFDEQQILLVTYMPAAYTHFCVARETLALLPPAIQAKIQPHLSLYFFGAQGADFCFFYPVLGGFSQNFGSYLHRQGGFAAFNVCKTFSVAPNLFAYSLGFITHYAADTTFHPFVYKKAGKSALKHTRIENAFDCYFKENSPGDRTQYFRAKLSHEDKKELFLLYASISARVGFPPLDQKGFYRAIRLFNAYLPPSSKLFSVKNSALVASLSQQADTLYRRAIFRAKDSCLAFYDCLKKKTPLPYEIFGKNYLTGTF